ncbi:hypothetical protein [Pedobacter alpinus]|uniref:Uncharacterized protein n=1 Tax=Pedobacter alpinus TaxID=1590643 RepID=A0ABW5TWD4_9SPHI
MKNKSIIERINAPTPKFFKKLRNIGLTLGSIGVAILAAPIALPAVLTTVAGYFATVGLVASAVASVTQETELEN